MPLTFQPALWALQQPHNHSHPLQLATDTEVAHRYIQLFPLFQSTVQPYQSTKMALERAASRIKVTCAPRLFWLLPWENVNRSTNLIKFTVRELRHINYS